MKYAWTIPFLCFFSTYLILHALLKTPAFAMPQLTGYRLGQAAKICSEHRLRLEIIQTRQDPELPDGTVIQQTPRANHHIKQRQTVFIAITERPTALMPSFIGASREEITALCARHNLKPKFYTLVYPYPTDHCFCQWPSPETPLHEKTVIFYLAAEQETYALWPNFKGLELQEAVSSLAEHAIETCTQITPKSGVKYFIVDQHPKAGACLNLGRTHEIIANFKISRNRPANCA